MDSEDQSNTTPPGHEDHGVHLCHKCGWPFPNPHPSAKHRRAHKRICGTIERYKLTDSEGHSLMVLSDDEHVSDEDRRTPSPKIGKWSFKEIGSGGICEKSNRSEDELFSDAVTEFSDSGFSPGIEECLEIAGELNKNLDKVVEGDKDTRQSLNVDASDDAIESPRSPRQSSQICHPEVIDTEINQWTITASQGTRTEELAVGLRLIDGSPCDLSPFITDSLVDAPEDNSNAYNRQEADGKVDGEDSGAKTLLDVAGVPSKNASEASEADGNAYNRQEADGKVDGEDSGAKTLLDVAGVPSKNASEASEVEPTLQEMSPLAVDESKQEPSEFEIPVSKHDFPPEISCVEHEAYANKVQIKTDSSEDMDGDSHSDLEDVCDTKGEAKEDMHVIYVANDLPLLEQSEILVGDFKDHKEVKFNLPLTLVSAEEIMHVEDDRKVTVDDEILFQSSHSSGNIHHSFSEDMDALKGNIKQEGGDKFIVGVPIEGDVETSKFKVTNSEIIGSHDLEACLGTSSETLKEQADSCLEGLQTHSFVDESRGTIPEYNPMDLSNAISVVTSVEDDAKNLTNLSGGDNADDHEIYKSKSAKYVTTGKENREGVKEEELSLSTNTLESGENLSVFIADQAVNSVCGDDTGDHEKEQSDTSENGKSEAPAAGEKCVRKTETEIESSLVISKSTYSDINPNSSVLDIDTSLGDIEQTHSNPQKCTNEVSQEATKELEVSNDSRVLAESVDEGSMVAASNHKGDVETAEKNSENTILKEPGSLPVESKIATTSFSSLEQNHSGDSGRGVSGIGSEPLQEEDVGKHSKRHGGVSAVDILVDSSSLSDSVEGNWGSVSVLSAQSDAPVSVDAEALPSTDSQVPEKSEKANLQIPKTAPDGHQSDKSDVFEHPSFMTVFESQGGVGQKILASEIQTEKNTQQPKSEALQDGWFPSLTNAVNDSQGRKKNEEIIAKVTNWSTGKQHAPLRTLLGEGNTETKSKSPNARQTPSVIQKDEASSKNNGSTVPTTNSIPSSEVPSDQAAKKETGKEWNSPARYPTDNKKERKKAKGKPIFPFICCSSVN